MKLWTWVRKHVLRRTRNGKHRTDGLSTMEKVALQASQPVISAWQKSNANTEKFPVVTSAQLTDSAKISSDSDVVLSVSEETREPYVPCHAASEPDVKTIVMHEAYVLDFEHDVAKKVQPIESSPSEPTD